ncbi:MAG: hypothetical protein ACRECR_05290 [Thermoplasmata archaeon]
MMRVAACGGPLFPKNGPRAGVAARPGGPGRVWPASLLVLILFLLPTGTIASPRGLPATP